MRSRIPKTPARPVLVAVTATLAALLLPSTASADSKVTVVASGLDNPRGLAFSDDGSLYVAEAGRGGSGPCFPGPEGGEACYGTSGAITKIRKDKQTRVVTGLPSLAAREGTEATGPSDVAFSDDRLHFTVGLGADPAKRPEVGKETLGWLLRAHSEKNGWRQVADIAEFEGKANPDGGEPDSNPNSLLATRGGFAVVDAGGNSLVRVNDDGKVSKIAVFPTRTVDAPAGVPNLPPKIPMQPVPTSVVRGPDGAYYVGELTGFPFPKDAARIYRVEPGEAPKVYAEGFTNIIDIAFDSRGRLFVLEIATNGLLTGDPTGALIRVKRDGAQEVVHSLGLHTPGGLALKDGSAYVSNCGTCPGKGEVLRIPLK